MQTGHPSCTDLHQADWDTSPGYTRDVPVDEKMSQRRDWQWNLSGNWVAPGRATQVAGNCQLHMLQLAGTAYIATYLSDWLASRCFFIEILAYGMALRMLTFTCTCTPTVSKRPLLLVDECFELISLRPDLLLGLVEDASMHEMAPGTRS